MDWDKLKAFYHVARTGSMTKTGEILNISQSAVSRQILLLESTLGATLLHRKARGVTLTENGEILYQATCRMLAEAESARTLIHDREEEPQGKLRVSTTVFFSSVWLMDFIPEFLKRYPKVRLVIVGEDKDPDLIAQESDVAIRPHMGARADLVQELLTGWNWKLYASQKYLDEFGTPETAEDLDNHRLIAFGSQSARPFESINWLLHEGARDGHARDPYLSVNSTHAICRAAEAGLGIATLSEEHVHLNKPDLVNILPDLKGPTADSHYIYPKNIKDSRKVQALGAFLKEVMRKKQK